MPIEQSRRTSEPELVALLERHGVTPGRGRTWRCPFHDDGKPSANVHQRTDGAWALHCFVCDYDEDVYGLETRFGVARPKNDKIAPASYTGLGKPKVAPDTANGHQAPQSAVSVRNSTAQKASKVFRTVDEAKKAVQGVVAAYTYTHPDSRQVELIVLRIEEPGGKRFMQLRACAGGFEFGGLPTTPLYNRIAMREAKLVVVCEGEKCVHALRPLNVVATTSPGGSAGADKADWSPLAGKVVVLWPDFDEPGEKYMQAVFAQLQQLEPRPEIHMIAVDQLGLNPKGDAVDFLAGIKGDIYAQRTAIEMVLADAYPIGSVLADYQRHQLAVISGKWRAINWPWPTLGESTKALYPETHTMVCGEGGTSKSLLLRQAVSFWLENGIAVADFELEDNKQFHMKRAHAQLAGESGIANDGWMRTHAEQFEQLTHEHAGMLKRVGECITDAPDTPMSMAAMLDWAVKQAKKGKQIIIIDPITACLQGAQMWNDDLVFILETRAALRKYGSRMIVVTHPRGKIAKGSTPSLADLAGGQAWPRFTQTVIWISQQELQSMSCRAPGLVSKEMVNRIIKVIKARNSWGTGCEVAMQFDGSSLRFKDHGVLVREKTGRGGR